ncbi:MAG TPA: glycosyltransferase family 39 protein [Ignavibacteria bacterium]|nr:glycosyltransferase family 39 protein [Ignavibacteria bacterium]HRF66218.1 glycosyltransferase family 39 protein [Ignavibacteria bacterium]HRJ03836.1 glycosyltransferase family 39 protein [Ignavibacteria bacterium]HRJ85095.1 glycosyltransferase family 39 protein [Ignavibacteria bacterium]
MKFIRSNKAVLSTAILTLALLVLYVFFKLFPPSAIIYKMAGMTFNDTARVDAVFYKYTLYLCLLFAGVLFGMWLRSGGYTSKIYTSLQNLFVSVSRIFNLNILFIIILLYLAVLFAAAIYYYDLGFDEAWYITFAGNFASGLYPYYTANERIAVIDTISMLPYYLASLVNFKFTLNEVWHFKLLASAFSVLTIAILYRITSSLYSRAAAILFVFFMVIQPGFGFVASSYFGEFFQAAFVFYGLYYWLKDAEGTTAKRIFIAALLFTAAIHTKFQLVIILSAVLLIMAFTDKDRKPLKLLLYTLLFTAVLSLFRTIPVLLDSPSLLRSLALITDLLAARSTSVSAALIFERIQLFNRFFPLAALIIISASFSFIMKNAFERFLLFFTLITAFWWIFIYPLTTYRNPFMAVITLCFMAAVLVVKLYDYSLRKFPGKESLLRYVSALSMLMLMLYGFSANLVYARIGYNDGVQFDLDGFKNRLFSPVKHDNTQKDFHKQLKQSISNTDTLYNGSFVTRFYIPNTIFTFERMTESLKNSQPGSEKLLLVTRDVYPLGFQKIYGELDSLVKSDTLQKRLILKTGEHELYGLKK